LARERNQFPDSRPNADLAPQPALFRAVLFESVSNLRPNLCFPSTSPDLKFVSSNIGFDIRDEKAGSFGISANPDGKIRHAVTCGVLSVLLQLVGTRLSNHDALRLWLAQLGFFC